MKCDNCGYKVNPGDQICINCGAKLSLNNTYMPEVGENYPKEENNKKFLIVNPNTNNII